MRTPQRPQAKNAQTTYRISNNKPSTMMTEIATSTQPILAHPWITWFDHSDYDFFSSFFISVTHYSDVFFLRRCWRRFRRLCSDKGEDKSTKWPLRKDTIVGTSHFRFLASSQQLAAKFAFLQNIPSINWRINRCHQDNHGSPTAASAYNHDRRRKSWALAVGKTTRVWFASSAPNANDPWVNDFGNTKMASS